MPTLPDADTLYAALLARDPAWEGRALVGVTSTSIFCRLTCPARKPRPENCRWFTDPDQARAAGFRPCKRCHPAATEAEADTLTARLHKMLRDDPARRWSEGDLRAMGLDPSTVRRGFQRCFGMSFLQMARQNRLRAGAQQLAHGGAVIEAQLDAGFESASGFRAAFSRLFGHAPDAMRVQGALLAEWIETPLGGMIALADEDHLHLLEFSDRTALAAQLARVSRAVGGKIGLGQSRIADAAATQIASYFAGERAAFDLPLSPHGTEFQRRVWDALRQIPAGQTRSYAQIAAAIGQPTAVRAVARANAANPIAIVIPCHRVIGADGTLTGYAGGLWRKQRLIAAEAAYRAREST